MRRVTLPSGWRRTERPALDVGPGERLLAWATAADGGVVGGTRDALYLTLPPAVGVTRLPWEGVEAADWDNETSVLRVSEVGSWGEERSEHRVGIDEPGRLLELVRERVTASVVLQRHVPIDGRRGVRVIARRAPSGRGEVSWVYEFDEGVDATDTDVLTAATAALAAARDEVGTL